MATTTHSAATSVITFEIKRDDADNSFRLLKAKLCNTKGVGNEPFLYVFNKNLHIFDNDIDIDKFLNP